LEPGQLFRLAPDGQSKQTVVAISSVIKREDASLAWTIAGADVAVIGLGGP